MSRHEIFLSTVTGAGQEPCQGCLGPTPYDADGMTLRRQVLELIHDVLVETVPEREWARRQLRDLLAANPDEPELALQQHLITVTTLGPYAYHGPDPKAADHKAADSTDGGGPPERRRRPG